jgi:amino acid adenylation domain-containing protein
MDSDIEETTFGWAAGEPADVPDCTLAELVEATARTRPDAVAVVHGSAELTYGELDRAAAALAARLTAAGAGPEVAVGVCVSRTPRLIVALLAVLKSGAYYVPLDPELPAARLALIAGDAAPVACVVDASTRSRLPEGGWQLIDAADTAGSGPGPTPARPDQLAYVIYTSGSTGRPKGVCVEHRCAVDLVVGSARAYRAGPDDRILAYASIGFDISVAEIFPTLTVGATLILADEQDRLSPDRLQALLQQHRVTVAEVPPSMLGLLDPAALPALKLMVVGGEAPSARQIARWVAAGPRVLNAYGPTEATVTATLMECTADETVSVPIGRPMDNHRVYVLDEAGALVAPGEPGELWISGPGVARGYLHLSELTDERFRPDPFTPGARMYGTGDRGRLNPDGTLQFLGRVDGQLNVRGFRIESGDVEARLRAHPEVRAAAVATHGAADDIRLVGYVVAAARTPVAADLAAWCVQGLPAAFVPSAFVVLGALPLDANGKVDRAALPAPAADAHRPIAVARTEAEARMLAVWADLLPGARIGVDDDFFALGGHSLLAMRLLARVRRDFGVALAPAAIYRHRSVAALAAEIEAATPRAEAGPIAGPTDAPAVLSYGQRQLWFVDRLNPEQPTYNLPLGLRLHGELNPAVLAEALGDVAARHETLRCSITMTGDQPVALIAAPGPVELPVEDLRGLPDAEDTLEKLADTDANAPFTLAEGPLWRARLIRLADADWALVLVLHHAIADGWSLSLFLEELGGHYTDRLAGSTTPSAPPAVRYRDFAAWQQRRLGGTEGFAARDFWRAALDGAPAALDLPADRARPLLQTHTPDRIRQALPAVLAQRVRDLAATHRVTPFVVLLTLFQVLLSRLAGAEDLVIACPVAGRSEPELEELIGLFVNTVPVRADLSGDPTLAQLFARTDAAALAAFGHAELPFSLIVEAVRPPRDLRRAPLAQVAFNLLNYPAERLALPGVTTAELPIEPPGALLDLTLYVHEAGRDLRLEVVYNRDLFDRARIEALLAQYVLLIEQAEGGTRAGRLSLVPPTARRVLPDPAAPLTAYAGPTVVDRFHDQARHTPDAPAVEGHDVNLTYAQLDAASDRVAAHLAAHGVRAGALVAVPAVRAGRLAVALLGIVKAGAVACLLDASHPAPRLAGMLARVRPHAWLAVDETPPPAAITAFLRGAGLACEETVPGILAAPAAGPVPAPPALDDPAYVLFTSGSTGHPNAVVATHRPLAHFTGWYASRFGLGPQDRFAVASGVAHDPVLRDIIVALCVGATVCVPAPDVHRAPDELLRWLRTRRVTVLHAPPQLARLLAAADGALPALRLLATGGDVLRSADVPALAATAPDADLVAFYGATETPQAVGWQRVADDPGRPQVPLGTGVDAAQLLVVDRHGHPAGVGELGEIVVRSPHLALGYLGDPAATAARFMDQALDAARTRRGYRTGDLGRYLPDGRVEFAGRRDAQVKVRGHRVEPGEVAAVLERHPGVRQALVVAFDAADDGKRLAAYVVPRDGARPHPDDLRRHLTAALPPYAIPATLVLIAAVPLGPNGKLDRAALPLPQPRTAVHQPPRSRAEQAVAPVWRDVLGTAAPGLDDNFFDLGGSSLHLVKVQRRLTAVLGRPVAVVDLFRYPTVRGLAAHLGDTPLTSRDTGAALRVARRTDLRRAGQAHRAHQAADRRQTGQR